MECSICKEDILETGYPCSIPCGHIFHGKCLLKWSESEQSCPTCRHEFELSRICAIFLPIVRKVDENFKFIISEEKPVKISIEPDPTERRELIMISEDEKEASLMVCVASVSIVVIICVFVFVKFSWF